MDITDTKFYKELKNRESDYIQGVIESAKKVKVQLAGRVPNLFPEYTLHDIDHSLRVMDYEADLIGDLTRFNDLEIAIIIHSALLHDVGMGVGQETVDKIKNGFFDTDSMVYSAMVKHYHGNENRAIQEFIRRNHAMMSAEIIQTVYRDFMIIPELETSDFSDDVATICKMHTRQLHVLLKLPEHKEKGRHSFNIKFMAHILRIADLLDIDSRRTPLTLYELIRPSEESDSEWRQHFLISNIDKIKISPDTNQKNIAFYGTCKNANIHRKLLKYFSWIDEELYTAIKNIEKMSKKYWINLKDRVDIKIEPEGYSFSNYFLSIDFKAITTLLMGEHIYGHKSLGLRELIQNGIDACKLRNESYLKNKVIGDDEYIPTVKVILDPDNQQVIVKDNGIGMSEDVIKKFFLNIGKSYYISDEFAFRGTTYKPIGNFGIGFLSCFMLSKNVTVRSRAIDSPTRFDIDLEQGSEFLCLTQIEDTKFTGTEVILDYDEFMHNMDLKDGDVYKFIKSFFIFDDVNFQLINRKSNTIDELNNPLDSKISKNHSEYLITLTPYLKEIEAYAKIKKRNKFISKISDITTSGTLEYYDGKKISAVNEDMVDIKSIYSEDKFKYLKIPVYYKHDKDDFEKALEYLENDLESTMDKFTPEDTIEFFAANAYQSEFIYGETDFDLETNITDEFTINDLLYESSSSGFCPNVDLVEIDAVSSADQSNFMVYTKGQMYYISRCTSHFYVRDVLVKDMSINEDMPTSSVYELSEIWVNVSNKDIIPEISRNNFDDKQKTDINYALTKAIHLAVRDTLGYNDIQKNLLNIFIKKYYDANNHLLLGKS